VRQVIGYLWRGVTRVGGGIFGFFDSVFFFSMSFEIIKRGRVGGTE